MAKELGGEAFQKNVLRVNLRIRIWEIWAKPVNPYFVSVAHMSDLTPMTASLNPCKKRKMFIF